MREAEKGAVGRRRQREEFAKREGVDNRVEKQREKQGREGGRQGKGVSVAGDDGEGAFFLIPLGD